MTSRSTLVALAAILASCGDPGPEESKPSTGEVPLFEGEGSRVEQGVEPLSGSAASTGNGGSSSLSTDEGSNPNVALDSNSADTSGSQGVSGNAATSGQPGVDAPALEEPSSLLPRSFPEAEGVDSAGLLSLINSLDQLDEVHSVMVVRHGNVVAEGWWAPYVPEDVHVLYSVSKSFNATAVGLAQQEGLLSITDTVLSHFSDVAPANPAAQFQTMQLRDLLMMASGHQADTIDTLRASANGEWSRAFLATQVQNQPGTNFVYNSGASYMLASAVQRATGSTVLDYLGPRLFEPLGIGGGIWGQSPEGVNLAGGGLALRTEDLAKFGQLYLQEGEWNGQQILDPEWVREATSAQISTGNNDGNWNHGYGYQFWQSRFGYRADGSLGQFVFVLPEQDVVLIITSATEATDAVMDVVWDSLIPALSGDALPEDANARQLLQSRLDSLALPTPEGASFSEMAAQVSGARFATQQNNQGITGVTLDFDSSTPTLVVEDAGGRHAISVGLGEWVRGRTGFKPRINELFDTSEQGISAIGAWIDDTTFSTRLAFNETPYILSANFRFNGQQVLVNMSYNIRWGNATEPQITGTR